MQNTVVMKKRSIDPMLKMIRESELLISNGMNQEQAAIYSRLKKYISPQEQRYAVKNTSIVIEGYAGTGKTFLISKLVNFITRTHKRWQIAMTAPTNKAVNVLYRASRLDESMNSVAFMTIHKLLGLTEEITDKGEQLFVQKKADRCVINNFRVLIVDEVSMLDDSLFKELIKYADSIHIIFLGDRCQIPPVNRMDCIPLKKDTGVSQDGYYFVREKLTQIMRQEQDNPIVRLSTTIRTYLGAEQPVTKLLPIEVDSKGNGVFWLDSKHQSERDRLRGLLKDYFDCWQFERDPNYAKVLAWRNKTVGSMNSIIREIRFGKDTPELVKGDWLITDKPILDDGAKQRVKFNTSDEFEVLDVRVGSHTPYRLGITKIFKTYECRIRCNTCEGTNVEDTIRVLHKDSHGLYVAELSILKAKAIASAGANGSWINYFNFMREFAQVKYNYAITVHKA